MERPPSDGGPRAGSGRRRLLAALVVMAVAGGAWLGLEPDTAATGAPRSSEPDAPVPPPLELRPPAPAPEVPGPPPDAGPPWSAPDLATLQVGFCGSLSDGGAAFTAPLPEALLARVLQRALHRGLPGGAGRAVRQALTVWAHLAPLEGRDAARRLVSDFPASLEPRLLLALAALRADAPEEALGALRRARELGPDEVELQLALAGATLFSPDLEEAIEGLAAAQASRRGLEYGPLLERLRVQQDLQRGARRLEQDGVTLLWPPALLGEPQARELLQAISRALDEAAALTATRRRGPLTVVVYPSRSELMAAACTPSWTTGLYDGVVRLVAQGPRPSLAQARHEAMHARRAGTGHPVPTWFEEGLAQSFARERAPLEQWTLMVRNRTWVPFQSLASAFMELGTTQDVNLAYAQSYAMVQLLRDLGGDAAIPVALAAFEQGADAETALARAAGRPVTGQDLLAFLERRLARAP